MTYIPRESDLKKLYEEIKEINPQVVTIIDFGSKKNFKQAIQSLFDGRKLDKPQSIKRNRSKR